MMPNWFFDHLKLFLFYPFFDQVPNKGSVLGNPCQSWTKMQESRLLGSYLGCVHCKSPNPLQPSLHHSMSIKKYFAATYINGVTFNASNVLRTSTSPCGFFSTICKYNYCFMNSNTDYNKGINQRYLKIWADVSRRIKLLTSHNISGFVCFIPNIAYGCCCFWCCCCCCCCCYCCRCCYTKGSTKSRLASTFCFIWVGILHITCCIIFALIIYAG